MRRCADARVEAFARLLEARAKAERKPRSHLIGALALLAEKIERAAEARRAENSWTRRDNSSTR